MCFIMSKNESSDTGTDTDDCRGRTTFIHVKQNLRDFTGILLL